MVVVRKEDIETMKKIDKMLYRAICYQDVKNNEDYNTIITFQNMIDRFTAEKKEISKKATKSHKKNKEYYNIMSSLTYHRKANNIEKVEYWKNKLKELKESGIC